MKQKLKNALTFICLICLSHTLHAEGETWDIINKSMSAWDSNGSSGTSLDEAWTRTKTYVNVTQKEGYVNIERTGLVASYLTSTTAPATVKTGAYTIDVKVRINQSNKTDTESAYEANVISICVGGKLMKIFLKYGDETGGYIFDTPVAVHKNSAKYMLNTSEWHVYRFVYHPATYTCDVYVDNSDEPVISGLKTHYDGSKNYIYLGADQNHYCNMDVEYVKFGTGNFALKTQINNVTVNSDSHIVGNARTITATVNTDLVDNGQKVFMALYDKDDNEKTTPVELTITNNTASAQFTMPATLAEGKYNIKAFVENNKIGSVTVKPKTKDYCIVGVSPLTSGILPAVTVEKFIIETEDYQIPSPTNEYIFPVVVDTKKHVGTDGKFLDGTEPLDRYYWYHTPHDDPGGMYLYTGPTLDGPWAEQGIKMTNDWAKANGLNTSHISSAHIIWNDIYNTYFMYFHGDNNQTNYATSDNLVDWTFGKTIVKYDDFSFSSREASYAKVFEYEVPGYNNKYVMMLMINENDARTIYWAHSTDGIDWIGVRKPLVTPKTSYKTVPGTTTKPSYSNNVSGPYFMIAGERYFVFFHSSAGNISVAEIGANFDMEVHWGSYLRSTDAVIADDGTGKMSAVSRVASPFFIQDDLGAWYLFFEAGHRLGANTAYARGDVQQKNDDATLASLTVSEGELTPQFAANVFEYTVNVGADITSFDIEAEATDNEYASIVGRGEFQLKTGENIFEVKVTAQDGVTKLTYKVTVTRQKSSVATLGSLQISAGTIEPAFDPEVSDYTITVEDHITTITLTAVASHSAATIEGDGMKTLEYGENPVEIIVTAEDGSTKTYNLTIIRKQNTGVNNIVSEDIVIQTANGTINVSLAGTATIQLYTISGVLIDKAVATGNFSKAVQQGIYLLKINGKAYKVIVR